MQITPDIRKLNQVWKPWRFTLSLPKGRFYLPFVFADFRRDIRQTDGLIKSLRGQTTLEEVMRVTSER